MPNLTEETIAKMRAVIAAIKAEPKFYDQDEFPNRHNCGTTCCAAGWAVWLNLGQTKYKRLITQGTDWPHEAIVTLGLPAWIDTNIRSRSIKDGLFRSYKSWPLQYRLQYDEATTAKQRAKAMADRWEFFIATDGTDDPTNWR